MREYASTREWKKWNHLTPRRKGTPGGTDTHGREGIDPPAGGGGATDPRGTPPSPKGGRGGERGRGEGEGDMAPRGAEGGWDRGGGEQRSGVATGRQGGEGVPPVGALEEVELDVAVLAAGHGAEERLPVPRHILRRQLHRVSAHNIDGSVGRMTGLGVKARRGEGGERSVSRTPGRSGGSLGLWRRGCVHEGSASVFWVERKLPRAANPGGEIRPHGSLRIRRNAVHRTTRCDQGGARGPRASARTPLGGIKKKVAPTPPTPATTHWPWG